MSGWNSHSFLIHENPLVQYTTEGVIGHCRALRVEAEISDDETYFTHAAQVDGVAYGVEGRGIEFCTENNLLNSIAYINQEFQLLGLACLKHDGTKCTSDVVFFINRLYELLTLYHKTAAVKEDLEARNHRLVCETDHHQSTALRMKRLQEQTDRELDQEREKNRQVSLKYNQVCMKLKSEKEDIKKLTAIVQSRDLHHKHEQKKREREVHRLKERLHQLLADKVPERKVGMDLMHAVSRRSEEGRRATWRTGPEKQEEEMYQMLISNYEDRHKELMLENGELRDCLLSLQRELSTLLKRMGDLSVTTPVLDMSTNSDLSVHSNDNEQAGQRRLLLTDLEEGYFQMPYDIVRHEIERTFKETCAQISDSMKKSLIRSVVKGHPTMTISQSAVSVSSEKDNLERKLTVETSEVERLRKQVNNYKAIIQQQEDLIRESLSSHTQSMEKSFFHESQLLKEKENLSEERKFFIEEKSNFEKERRAFTEAAVCLNKERQLLQEERARLIKQQLLNRSSFKDGWQTKLKGDGHNSRLLPATPVFSPAKSNDRVLVSSLHNCTELYKALGISQLSDTSNSKMSGSISSSTSNSKMSGSISSAQSCRRGSTSSRNGDFNLQLQQTASVSSSVDAQSLSSSILSSFTCSPPTDILTSSEDIMISHINSALQRSKTNDI